jgi:hypothetical protein
MPRLAHPHSESNADPQLARWPKPPFHHQPGLHPLPFTGDWGRSAADEVALDPLTPWRLELPPAVIPR